MQFISTRNGVTIVYDKMMCIHLSMMLVHEVQVWWKYIIHHTRQLIIHSIINKVECKVEWEKTTSNMIGNWYANQTVQVHYIDITGYPIHS